MKNSIASRLRSIATSVPSLEDAGEGKVSVTLPEPETTVATGEAEGEDENLTAKTVEVKTPMAVETAETEVTGDIVEAETTVQEDAEQVTTSTESSEAGDVSVTLKAIDETPADGAAAPGEDEKLKTTIEVVGEGQPVESAETEVTGSIDEGDTTVSTEGFGGGVLGFILGATGGLYGGYANAAAESKKKEIIKVAETIKQIRKEGLAAAKADGKRISDTQEDSLANTSTGAVIKGAILGSIGFGIYGAYVGSKLQNAERDLRKKYAQLQELIEEDQAKKAGVSQESLSAAEAAALFAEGASAAAEAAAGAEHGESAAAEVVEDIVAEDVVADAVQEAGVAEVAGEEAAAEVVEAGEAAEEAGVGETALDAAAPEEAAEEGAAEVSEADDAVIDDSIEGAEEGMAEEEEALETFEGAEATVESLIEQLTQAQKEGGLTPQSARFFHLSLESLAQTLTNEPLPAGSVPSLESYGGDMSRRDATNISMEAVDGWWEKIKQAIAQAWEALKQWAQKFIKALLDKSERVLQRAKAVRSKANQAKGGELKAGGFAKQIAVGNKVDLNGLQTLPAVVDDIAKRGAAGDQAMASLMEAIRKAATAGDAEGTIEALTTPAMGMFNDSKSAIFKTENGGVHSTDVLPGNVQFDFTDMQPNSNTQPTLKKRQNEAELAGSIRALSSAEINTVGTRVITVVEQIRRTRNQLEKLQAEERELINVKPPEGAERSTRLLLWALTKAAQNMRKAITAYQSTMLKYVVDVCDGYVSYAEASVGAAPAAAPAPKALPAA